jgi:hypothetical protein
MCSDRGSGTALNYALSMLAEQAREFKRQVCCAAGESNPNAPQGINSSGLREATVRSLCNLLYNSAVYVGRRTHWCSRFLVGDVSILYLLTARREAVMQLNYV